MSRQTLPLSCQNHPNLIRRHFSRSLSTCGSAERTLAVFVGGARTPGFPPGLAACGRIWGVCTPDVGTPLCVAAWLIFITAHNDGARE